MVVMMIIMIISGEKHMHMKFCELVDIIRI